MEKLDALRQWAHDEKVIILDRQLPFSSEMTKAVTIHLNNSDIWGIAIDTGRMENEAEEYSSLLHECGHYATGTTHGLNSPFDIVAKHEYKANKWAVKRALTAEELDAAVADGCTEIWQLAERFHVTEDLMRKAVCWYTFGNLASDLYFE